MYGEPLHPFLPISSFMSLRVSSNPYGYRELLVYQKAEALQGACAVFTATFPREKTPVALADQMDRSARSVKQNIVEGWKRNSTKEYYDFLSFAIGANAELEEDCNDIIKGFYKGIEWGKGEKWGIQEVERLPFYPLQPHLPLLVQLKLRCKELNLLFKKLQDSLSGKMQAEHTMSSADKFASSVKKSKSEDDWYEKTLSEQGLIRLPNGRIVPKTP